MNESHSHLKAGLLAALVAAIGLSASAQTNQPSRTGPKEFGDFKIITERNIFDPNRRPPPPPNTYRPQVVVDTFSLAGTMTYDNGLYAVFDGNNYDYHKVLQPGGRIATYTVSTINIDSVKLALGTNEVELKVGMQMRRGQDGKWSPGEYNSETSYGFNSSRSRSQFGGGFNGNGNDRRRGYNNGNSYSGRSRNRQFGGNESGMTSTIVNAGAESGDDGSGGSSAAADEPTDPVARMMARRARESGGGGNAEDNQNNGGNQDAPINVNGMPNENQPGNDQPANDNRPDENQPGQPGQQGQPGQPGQPGDQPNPNTRIPNGDANSPQNLNLNNEN